MMSRTTTTLAVSNPKAALERNRILAKGLRQAGLRYWIGATVGPHEKVKL
jgi:hypothetical protein